MEIELCSHCTELINYCRYIPGITRLHPFYYPKVCAYDKILNDNDVDMIKLMCNMTCNDEIKIDFPSKFDLLYLV